MFRRTYLVFLVTSLVVVGSATGTFAANDVGWDQVFRGSGNQYASWNATTTPDKVRAYSSTGAVHSNRCQDLFFDWWTNGDGHYDARVVRNCKDNSHRETEQNGDNWHKENDPRRTLAGVQKAAGCIYYINITSYVSPDAIVDCSQLTQTRDNVTDSHSYGASGNNFFVHFWIRWPNGDKDIVSGGDAWRSDA